MQATFASLPQTSSKFERGHRPTKASMPRKQTSKMPGLPTANENVPTLTERFAAVNARLKELDERFAAKDAEVKDLDERIAAKDEEIAALNAIKEHIMQNIARAQKGKQAIAKKKVNHQ